MINSKTKPNNNKKRSTKVLTYASECVQFHILLSSKRFRVLFITFRGKISIDDDDDDNDDDDDVNDDNDDDGSDDNNDNDDGDDDNNKIGIRQRTSKKQI
jgi:hypothetical protein